MVPAITRSGDMAGNPFSGVQIVTEGFVLFKVQGAPAATEEINRTEAKLKKRREHRNLREFKRDFLSEHGLVLRQMV